jgi:hypothetical protein
MKISHRPDLSYIVVSRFQARAALHLAGLLEAVEEAMQGEAINPIIKLAWEHAQEFRRSSPAILGMAQSFGWSDAQLDDLFIMASRITA